MITPTHDHVLIIDDHELVGTSLMLSLRAEGLRVDWRGNDGGEAGILADVRHHFQRGGAAESHRSTIGNCSRRSCGDDGNANAQ